MTENTSNKPPIWFWIVSVFALIWNSMGINGFFSQIYKTESFTNQHTPEQIEIISTLPTWHTACFAIAVFTAVIGCLLLLLRKKWAYMLLLISFIAATIQQLYGLFAVDLGNAYTIAAIIIILFAAFLVWFAKHATQKKWIS